MSEPTETIAANRRRWLVMMRSGFAKKGVIEVDGRGRPVDPDGGFCAVGLMYSMFTGPDDGPKAFWTALGVGQRETTRIIELNDTSMTFPKIADRVAAA